MYLRNRDTECAAGFFNGIVEPAAQDGQDIDIFARAGWEEVT